MTLHAETDGWLNQEPVYYGVQVGVQLTISTPSIRTLELAPKKVKRVENQAGQTAQCPCGLSCSLIMGDSHPREGRHR
ncbi:MAG: hypothetical protein L0338_23670, partial [Acidobacteria bacterium]|nr:hypothetical protein [Acidobacteriota bacterium]